MGNECRRRGGEFLVAPGWNKVGDLAHVKTDLENIKEFLRLK